MRTSSVAVPVSVSISTGFRDSLIVWVAVLVADPSLRRPVRAASVDLPVVLRLEGLELIPAIPPKAPAGTGLTAAQRRRRSIGRVLAVDGFTEVLPYPFMPAGVFDQCGLAPRRRASPPSVDESPTYFGSLSS